MNLQWKPADELVVALPTADVLLTEQGFTGPVQGKGHGLQRALIFTLLQHLARASKIDPPAGEDVHDEPAEDSRALILAIEEPELYQHPNKQRHLSRILWEISQGKHPGILSGTQVVCCSHSPHFVSTERFNEVGLARREEIEPGAGKECVVRTVTYDEIIEALQEAWQTTNGYTAESLSARLHVLNPEVAEGFFASAVALVEGVSDKAAILATATNMGIDLEGKGISIVAVDGKTNLDRVAIIFLKLGVPTYLIWDCDDNLPDESSKKLETNMVLQRLCGAHEILPITEKVEWNYACFATCLEDKLHSEMPTLDADSGYVAHQYGLKKNKVLKNPVAMSVVLKIAASKGHRSAFLENIVERVAALVP